MRNKTINSLLFLLLEKVCPLVTIANSLDTENKAGEFGDSYIAECAVGYKVQGETNSITTLVTTCTSTAQWNDTRPCESWSHISMIFEQSEFSIWLANRH